MNFSDLNLSKPLLHALADLEYFEATPIQSEAFPVIMSGRDMIGIAQTGTGKTFAYLLPVLRRLKFSSQKHPIVLVLVPTRELVLQVTEEIKKLCPYISVRSGGIYGGGNINTQKSMVFKGLDILVSTPGRVIDLGSIGAVRLNHIQMLIIDEVDELLHHGFRAQLRQITEMLPARRQNIMFSATLTPEVEQLLDTYFSEPVKVEIARHGTPIDKITQSLYHAPNFNTKVNLLVSLLRDETMTKVLAFTSTIKNADKLYNQVKKSLGDDAGVIHSGRSQPQRFAALNAFDKGKLRLLIATDVAARGLDIRDVSHVVNFDTPSSPSDYIHRIGRTGRAGKAGASITFANEVEAPTIPLIEELMGLTIPLFDLPEDVEVSSQFSKDELPPTRVKNYLRNGKQKKPSGAFHEKKAKNLKKQLGGPTRRHGLKTRSINRAVKRNRSKK